MTNINSLLAWCKLRHSWAGEAARTVASKSHLFPNFNRYNAKPIKPNARRTILEGSETAVIDVIAPLITTVWPGELLRRQTIYREVVEHISKDQLFMDVDTVEPGVDFVRVIEDAVGKCDVLPALIGKRWTNVRRGAKSRLDDPNDFVRLEISTALARDIRVIPVLVDGMRMTAETVLPTSIKALTRRHAMEISHTRFNYDLEQLIAPVRKVLGATEGKRVSKLEPGSLFRDKLKDGSQGPEMVVILAGTF
jgi:Sulfatase-modifying factor enzyme 1